MKVFQCSYYWQKRGAFEEIEVVVIAECDSVALGMALEKYHTTSKEDWIITEIPIDSRGIFEISARNN